MHFGYAFVLGLAGACGLLAPGMVKAQDYDEVTARLAGAPAPVAEWTAVQFVLTHDGWRDTGIQLRAGMAVTLLGFGALDGVLPSPVLPRHLVWARIGARGEVFKMAADQHTFVASRSGRLQITVRPLAVYWADRHGTFPDYTPRIPPVPVDIRVLAIRWQGDPIEGLARLSQRSDDIFALALDNYRYTPQLPDGFEYFWNTGEARAFSAWSDGRWRGLRARIDRDYAVIQRKVDVPLAGSTGLDFAWQYAALPARGPETSDANYDYLSIALEFDNGQHLTWLWSPFVDSGRAFRSPLQWWKERQTHIVVQSGSAGLGEWHQHRRTVATDYDAAIGGVRPKRITGVWFIAVGLFGGRAAHAYFADVVLTSPQGVLEIFPPQK